MIPLPSIIQDDLNKQVHTASFMSIIPEINRAWITIDSKIMFWNYLSGKEVDRYDGLNEIIVSVAISAPKPGVFLDSVKYVLVIATTVEVVILAVSWNESGSDLKIIPTAYVVPSDNVTMFKVIGSQSGRIFMGGQDGLLYELDYDYKENKIASILGYDGSAAKCQKRNHNAWSWRAVLPPFIRTMFLGDESLTDLVVDDMRHLLYAITSTNNVRVVYLGSDNKSTICLINSFDILQNIKHFLSYSARNLDTVPRMDFFQDDIDSTQIVGFHIVPLTESKTIHAVAALQSGVRVYLQLNTWTSSGPRHYGPYHPAFVPQSQDTKLEIAFIKGPPTREALLDSQHSIDSAYDSGYLPSAANIKENKVKISSSYYSNGVFLTAINNKDALLPDELLGIGEDLTNRKSNVALAGGPTAVGLNQRYDPLLPSLRESVAIINSMQGKQTMNYKIMDIKESCRPIHSSKSAPLWALYLASASPVANDVREQSNFKSITSTSDTTGNSCTPVYYSTAIGAAGRSASMGVSDCHVPHIAPLSEFVLQSVSTSTQREFLCLTRYGIIVVCKNRPIDYLAKCLLSFDGNFDAVAYYEKVDEFFKYFGHVESCAVCLEIICGLPEDLSVGSSLGFASGNTAVSSDGKSLRNRALKAILRFGGTPGFETIGRGSIAGLSSIGDMSSRDSRLAAGTLTPNFFFSHKHDAILIVLSRILRPLWLRPVVEGKALSSSICTQSFITTMKGTMERFLNFLRDFYPAAVTRDVYAKKAASVVPKASFDKTGQNSSYINNGLLTDRIFFQGNTTIQDPQKQFNMDAQDMEDKDIHGFFRVMSRSSQALTLLQVLIVVQNVHKIPINWIDLGNISFRSLVVSSNVHDKIKRLLHNVIYQLGKSSEKRNEKIADELTKKLTDDCYLYFSAGDGFVYEAAKLMELMRIELANNPTGSSSVLKSQADGLIYLLLQASKYWVSLTDVKDDAGQDKSQLTLYCNMLSQLGSVGALGIVYLCLYVAKNFESDNKVSADEGIAAGNDWERNLYHRGEVLSDTDKNHGRELCYRCLIRYLEMALQSSTSSLSADDKTAKLMVEKILEISSDPLLRDMVYKSLVNVNFDELIQINSPDVQEFLSKSDMQSEDPKYLYRYYESHTMYKEAANYMYGLAHSEDVIQVEKRLKYLQLAVDSATRVCEFSASEMTLDNSDSNIAYTDFLREIKDEIIVVGYQIEAYNEVKVRQSEYQYNRNSAEPSAAEVNNILNVLEMKLMSISDLFNDVLLPFNLWTLALGLLQHSGLDAPDAVRKLWKSIVYRYVCMQCSVCSFIYCEVSGYIES